MKCLRFYLQRAPGDPFRKWLTLVQPASDWTGVFVLRQPGIMAGQTVTLQGNLDPARLLSSNSGIKKRSDKDAEWFWARHDISLIWVTEFFPMYR